VQYRNRICLFSSFYVGRICCPLAIRCSPFPLLVLATLLGLVLSLSARFAFAQTVAIKGDHSVTDSMLTSSAPTDLPLTIRLSLKLRNPKQLKQLLEDQQNPASPRFHHWLTPAQFEQRFGRTPSEVRSVSNWLRDQGFQVDNQTARNITASATANIAQTAFHTQIAASPDNQRYANLSDPQIPAHFADIIGSIEGLSNTAKALPLARMSPRSFTVSPLPSGLDADLAIEGLPILGPVPIFTNGNGVGFGPQDFYTFYDETALQNAGTDGSGGDCIALPETSDYLASAVTLFDSTFSLPPADITEVFPDGSDPGIGPAATEALIDIEWSHTVAPGAPIIVYVGARAFALQDAIHQAVTANTCGAISISFEYCDVNPSFFTGTLDPMFAQAAAQGQSVFVASGDTGAAGVAEPAGAIGCGTGTSRNVSEMAADPNVTGVGGTEFIPDYDSNDNDIGSVPESVWDDLTGSLAGAGGGGASAIFSKPAFQSGSTPADGARDVPDIAYAASAINPGFYLGYEASNKTAAVGCCVGGTSIAAPMWAGLTKLISQNNGRLGNIDPRLYQLGPFGNTVGIRDVTTGNNSFNDVTGFNAVPGYDQATGWGTADVATLVNSWDIVLPTPTPTPSPSPTPTPSPSPTPTPSPSSPGISPTSINFANVIINRTSSPRTVAITNPASSHANLLLTGSSIPTHFSISTTGTTCANGKSLAPGSSCAYSLTFQPTTVGTLNGTFSVNDNARNSPQSVSLSGSGIK
jgi:subtilase family serine protease